ncbi:MAG: VTC domain-containing protein [Myxococcaceae bacterium]|nr:VTC domain-containing protein [Myxococcaceae bacterium]
MSALAWTGPSPMERASVELDHERRFQPTSEVVQAFLTATQAFTEPCVYEPGRPYAFTRTTYFDTEGLSLLASSGTGCAQRLRLREYAEAAELTRPPVLTGLRYLEVKATTGARRMKSRRPVSAEEADALLGGTPLPAGSAVGSLLRQLTHAPVRPWVTTWYRRTTRVNSDGRVRITLDEDLLFALPPDPAGHAPPARPLKHASCPLLEVKWAGRAPPWLEQSLLPLAGSESHGSKFEQGMCALFSSVLGPLVLSPR